MKNNPLLYIAYFLLILYLLINTGIVSDEFITIAQLKEKSFSEMLFPREFSNFREFIDTPLMHFTHYIWYYFFRLDSSVVDSIFKIIYICLSFYLISRFFRLYLDRQAALLVSFLFLFFPSHDSTIYCFMAQYLTLSFAFYFYAFYLAHHNKLILAFLSALAASFISYGSSIIALTLFLLFALNKQFKKGLVLLIPNVLYASYYIFITKVVGAGADKLAKDLDICSIIKLFFLQILTFIDATIGPSMWLKIYYSFSQISMPSIIIGILLAIIFYKKYQVPVRQYNGKLMFCLVVLTFLSFAMFAVTGRYPQLAFNLGNRVTIFGTVLIAYLIALMPLSHKLRTAIFGLLIFTILGISDHWKDWNLHQQKVIANIRNNQDLKNYHDAKTIYVSGNQYSKYGPMSHIEFFSEDWVTGPVFNLSLENKTIEAKTINKRHKYENGYLIDTKYNRKTKINEYINIYDSEKDKLIKLDLEEINSYIDSLPQENRHWIQTLDAEFIKNIINNLSSSWNYTL